MAAAPAIRLSGLHFAYPPISPGAEPVPVLGGLSFDAPRGQRIALMGPVSSGKSTLALILAGLAPEMTGGRLEGQVQVAGLDVRQTPAARLSQHLGLVFQEPERQLFNMTVAAEVAFGLEGQAMLPREISERVDSALKQVGLAGLAERPPWQLSGGQQKRLALATVLATRPELIVLDEPMAGLDPAGRRDVAVSLDELKRTDGTTILVLEKDAEFVAGWADRVLVLAKGRIVLDGTPEKVFRQVERLQALGLAAPRLAELARRLRPLGVTMPFLQVRTAAESLKNQLGGMARLTETAEQRRAARTGSFSPNSSAPPAISLQALDFTYPGGHEALAGVSLAVPVGQFVALAGPNGSGKSTLARHLNGLLQPGAGVVQIDGQATAGRAAGELARQVGYVFQNPDHQIFAASVRDELRFGPRNLGLGGAELTWRVEEALAVFGLDEWADTPPAVLGYGLRKLVTLASVWAMQPAIWVLDEPTTGLDARHSDLLMARLRALQAAGRTILLITHHLQLAAEMAERLVVLHEGRVVLDGPTAAVLADAEALARYDLRPPALARLSAELAPLGFAHPALSLDDFVTAWKRATGSHAF